eukprot:12797623-Alexandrium_andersonii.AAC.1
MPDGDCRRSCTSDSKAWHPLSLRALMTHSTCSLTTSDACHCALMVLALWCNTYNCGSGLLLVHAINAN